MQSDASSADHWFAIACGRRTEVWLQKFCSAEAAEQPAIVWIVIFFKKWSFITGTGYKSL